MSRPVDKHSADLVTFSTDSLIPAAKTKADVHCRMHKHHPSHPSGHDYDPEEDLEILKTLSFQC